MVDVTKPIYGEIWANSGEKLSPGTDKIATGWIQEMMPYQYENFLQNRTDVAISYLLQKGIPEWSAEQEYIANKSVVTYSGQLYLATATSTNVLPTVAASWRRLTLTFGANGAIPVAFGGTGATNAADARTNLGIGSAATVNLPASNGVVVKLADNSLVARTITGTSGYITVTNGDGVAGNPTINVGANVAKTDQDAAWTTKTSIKIPSGTTAERGTGAPGRIRFNIESGVYEGYDNTGWSPIGSNGTMDVQDFQGDGTTTSFTLSSTPRAENNTQVFFNGIYQQKNSYELVGNSLVFDEAPAADISIEIVTIASVAIGTTTAAQTSVVDSRDYYRGNNVEEALSEVGNKLKQTVLTYPTLAEAQAAAATLPDGQRLVVVENASEYTVLSEALQFSRSVYSEKTPLDYQAKGNGIDNDSAAFSAFESVYQHRVVDLKGRTYFCESGDFNKNIYVNGVITNRADGSPTVLDVRKKGKIPNEAIRYQPDVGNGYLAARLRAGATGSQSIIQSMAFDTKASVLVTLRNDGTTAGGAEKMVLEYYWWGASRDLRPYFKSESTQWLGHQALGIQNAGTGQTFIWTRGGSDIEATQALYARRATVNMSTGVLENKSEFKIFSESENFVPNTAQCLSVSLDGTILVATCTRQTPENIERVVRVWRTSTFVTSGSDYSNDYVYEFTIPKPYTFPLQAISTDGQFIYTLDGNASYDNFGRVHVFTLEGVQIINDGRMLLGRVDAKNLETDSGYTLYYEQEGLCFLPIGRDMSLCVLNMGGKDQNSVSPDFNRHVALVSASVFPTMLYNQGGLVGTTPTMFCNSEQDVMIPHGTSFTIYEALQGGGAPGSGTKVFEASTSIFQAAGFSVGVTANTIGYSRSGGNVSMQLAALDASQSAYFRVANTTRSAILQAGTTGTAGVFCQTTNRWIFGASTTAAFTDFPLEVKGILKPRGGDNIYSNGDPAARWSVIYAGTGAINTSDAREKSEPQTIDDALLDAWGDVQLVAFQWLTSIHQKGEDGARWHFGVIAQQVRDAFAARGIDGTRYGLLCFDEWESTAEVLDEDGNTIEPALEAGNRWGIRADQCLFLEAAYQRRRAERIEARLTAIESKL